MASTCSTAAFDSDDCLAAKISGLPYPSTTFKLVHLCLQCYTLLSRPTLKAKRPSKNAEPFF